jgi:FtsH ternary system domain X6
MTDNPPPKVVSRFEANLLRILRFFLKHVPAEQAMRLVHDRIDRPKCLSADAVHLVRDSLAKGCVLYVARAGAWKRDRFLRDGSPKFGRLWERSPVERLTLSFSKHALDFLIWITASRPKEERPVWRTEDKNLTVADRLLLFLAYEALRTDTDLAAVLRSSPAFSMNALIWLAYPNDFAGEPLDVPAFDVWLTEPGNLILEALQPVFEHRWLEIERSKGQIGDWSLLHQQGQVQLQLMEAFTQAVDSAGRRDLVRFLMVVMSRVLATPDMAPTFWTGGLQGTGPQRLADRLEAQRSALAVLRQAERLRGWERAARRSGYLDEDYEASKFWLSEWERFGPPPEPGKEKQTFSVFVDRADRVLQQLEPLRVG